MRLSPSILVVTLWPVLNLGAVGCGGGDSSSLGLDRSKYLDELSLDEIRQCCLWKAGLAEPGQHQCSDGNTVSIQTTSECFKSAEQGAPAPHCLVSLAEDCFESAAGDPCKLLVTEACKSYEACLKRK